MIIDRKLISDEVIEARIGWLQEQLLNEICATDSSSNDYLFENNVKDIAEADEEKIEAIKANLERLEKNQKTRIANIPYFEKQIQFLQSVLKNKTGFIEINENLKSL